MSYLVSFSYNYTAFFCLVKNAKDEISAIEETKQLLREKKEWSETKINYYHFAAEIIDITNNASLIIEYLDMG